MGVVVLGGLNMDLILHMPVPAGPGETREGTTVHTTPGGKGGNQAVAAARQLERGSVEMVALLGEDDFGAAMRRALDDAGVGTRLVRTSADGPTGVAVIIVDGRGENSVNAVYGVNARCGPAQAEDVRAALAASAAPRLLLVQQEIPLPVTVEAMRAARALGATVILDPAPTRADAAAAIALADVLTPNEHEAADLCGFAVDGPEAARAAARMLRERGPGAVIVTLGAGGAWVEAPGCSAHVAAPSVEAVATVGAGDAFNGGFAAALSRGEPLMDAVRAGVASGALCATRPGAQEAMPSGAEVRALRAGAW